MKRPAICPNGHEMTAIFEPSIEKGKWYAVFSCNKCGWTSPWREADDSETAKERAYIEAIKPFSGVVLTVKDIFDTKFPCPVWVEKRGEEQLGVDILTGVNQGGIYSLWSGESPDVSLAEYGITKRYWIKEPNDDERAFAKWGDE